MHGAAPGPGSQAAITDFCGCRERSLPPGRFIQMGRSGNGAFPGAAELQISFLSSFPLPDDGRLATSRNTPGNGGVAGSHCQRRIGGAGWPCTENTSDRRERPASTPRRVRTRWQCGRQLRMTAGTDRPGKIRNGPSAWAPRSSWRQSAVRLRLVPAGRLPVGPRR